ncbi:MAG: ImmA/IrrE family metallo-endopeptidase [Alphaproteobacteria bacterium]|nr:ImmA/IrrE family metallo-endopeptidase [Alphaproteobacteria bacterium]
MAKLVPFLSEEQIERDAASLLGEFAQKRGAGIQPPVPIEDIVEKHLRLGIEFDDTHRLFGVPRDPEGDADILGAIFFDDRRIVIDQSLDPEENSFKEGRYRFTLAHEGGGHWRLHRHLFVKDPAQIALFVGPTPPAVICRSSQAKDRVEWQADAYASCLLMPKDLLIEAWRERFGDNNARILKRNSRLTLPGNVGDEIASALRSYDQQRYNEALNEFVRPFAEKFQVSMVSMRIRLERIGLLHRDVPRQLWFQSAR